MHATTQFCILTLLALSCGASVHELKPTASGYCPSYTIINTRGTLEPQDESPGFTTINKRVMNAVSGGKIYNTSYPADFLQITCLCITSPNIPCPNTTYWGTEDIVKKISSTLMTSPDECFILEGYSQGASATVDAMPQLTGANFDAVKGVFLIGDPYHKPGLACNVDNMRGNSTINANGTFACRTKGIPSNWVSKTMDVCIYVSSTMLSPLNYALANYLCPGRWCLRLERWLWYQLTALAVPDRHSYPGAWY
jgi:hypothetical protein